MKKLLLALTLVFSLSAVYADDAAAPKTAKEKAIAARKKKASKKPVEKTQIAAPVPKEERKTTMNQNLQEWLTKMKKRVSAARSKQNKLVAVAAVRGDEKTDPAPLYWKGKEGEKPVDAAEIEKFNEAIETAASGDADAAKVKLQQFVESHPKSPLVADANETLAKLSVAEDAGDAPDPTTAP